MSFINLLISLRGVLYALAFTFTSAAAVAGTDGVVTSQAFTGVKVNGGNVSWSLVAGTSQLTLSEDFKVPDTPAPHWQVVDGKGQIYLLQRLVIKDGKFHRTIAVPAFVSDVAKVQIWCAFAETLLGEAAFPAVIPLSEPARCRVATTGAFAGPKANTGRVTAFKQGNVLVLALSDDFKVPDTPAPHWQVVDSTGRTYLLQRLLVKGEKLNRTIAVPAYVQDVAKVQIWCAFAETLLGEAAFDEVVMD